MNEDNNVKAVVGNIRIKENTKKVKLDKYGKEKVSLGKKIFVWAMFIAMFAAFIVPLAIYFINYAINK
jgi:uncharacterized membrane protein